MRVTVTDYDGILTNAIKAVSALRHSNELHLPKDQVRPNNRLHMFGAILFF